MKVLMKYSGMTLILHIIIMFSILRLTFQMTARRLTKRLPDTTWLLIIDMLVDGQVCPLSLGVADKRRQLLVTDFRVNRRLTLRCH